ncbi:MAG: DinB family protein [Flavobacteriales bacterium]|nr:DinB family protein [Flavobacteriales bacterium]
MTSRKELLQAYELMEKERQQLLESLGQYSEEVLTKKPSANEWSITEVIYHLKVAEDGALRYMRKKLEVGGHQKATFAAGVKQRLLNLAVSLPVKYKAPRVAQIPEGTNVSFAQALEEWNAVRDGLRNEYETVDEKLIDNELFKHPAAGKMSILQSVRFMRQHMIRHIGQVERTLKSVS